MNDTTTLDKQLQALTEWDDQPTELWKTALAKTPRTKRGLLTKSITSPALRVAALFLLLVAITGAILPATTGNESIASSTDKPSQFLQYTQPRAHAPSSRLLSTLSDDMVAPKSRAEDTGSFASAATYTRAIARTATIDLRVDDVHAAFFLIPGVLDTTAGEHVQSSSIQGEGENASAQIALRVQSPRLNDALASLRALGTVATEGVQARDVTNQLIDLDARLRNAERVEQEMLSLLSSRTDAPLADLLELQRAIADVRLNIEQLAAQRTNLAATAELATIRVSITKLTEKDTPEPRATQSSYFTNSIARAWNDGIRALINTIALLLRGLIGGLIWWIALATITLAAVKFSKRHGITPAS